MMECGDAFGGFVSDFTLDFASRLMFHVCIVFDCMLVFFFNCIEVY